jgi:putative transposase
VLLAHKIALDPNNAQATHLARAAGTARFAYNWGLAEWTKQYQRHLADPAVPAPSEGAIGRRLNAIKRAEFPWMLSVTKNAPQMAIRQLGNAFRNFFAKRAKFPSFRKKGNRDRFSITNDKFKVEGKRIRIPVLGWVKMREALRFPGKIMSATVSRYCDRWYVSISVEVAPPDPHVGTENQGAVGVDLGLISLATLSNGEIITGPKAHKKLLSRLQRADRNLSRKQKDSANREKARKRLAKVHKRIWDLRNDAHHRFSTSLCRRFSIIGLENLNVGGMIKNRTLARAIADAGWYSLRMQIEYKAARHGGLVHIASRCFPSSKICSSCGDKRQTLPLSVREWCCDSCGEHHYRDVNAAKNLKNLAVSSTVTACGEEGAGRKMFPVKPSSMKQEISSES